MVFQDPMQTHNPVLTIGRQMTDIQYRDKASRAEKRKRAAAMLAQVGIPDPERRLDQFPHEFSGGMRQRIAIAMALMAKPALLIADEPTTALDATLEVQIIHRLKELQADFGCSILFISHHLGVIAELCDEVAVMYAGEVVERGSVRDVFHGARHPYTARLIDCDPGRIAERTRVLPTIPGEIPDLVDLPQGCIFAGRCPERFERCQGERPGQAAVGGTHVAACHLLEAGGRAVSALLEIADLHVRFGIPTGFLGSLGIGPQHTIEAVAGVSITVEEAETVAIVGESGSGKTTLARAAAGLVPAEHGSVSFRGEELLGLGEAALRPHRRDIAMMFQDPVGSLSPRLTVKSLITEPFKIQGMKERDLNAEAARLLGLVGLPAEFAQRYPYQLSGGQARRVGVARALALEPKLILADEPTAGLDVSVQGEVLNLLGDLRDRLGLSIMIITHNLNVVRHIADRMAIMYLGRFVEQGPTDEIFKHPRHPYTLALLSANPEPDPDAQLDRVELKGEVPSLMNRPGGCEFHTRCPFVQERCRGEAPAIAQDRPGHLLTCHYPLHREGAAAG